MQPLFNSYIKKLVAVVLALKEKPIQHLNFIQCREKKHKEKKKKMIEFVYLNMFGRYK